MIAFFVVGVLRLVYDREDGNRGSFSWLVAVLLLLRLLLLIRQYVPYIKLLLAEGL